MNAGYQPEDTQRWLAEPNKSVERTEFARDRARIMHSSALRRLGVKTQVMQAGLEDFPRTRLTHSLECAQIGRELGSALGCDPDLVDTACLSHDLGHPPFGHNGETELNRLAADIGGFEGNAQTFRLLTRLEPKAFSPVDGPRPNESIGLNLTRASLDAASKYPWVREVNQSKFGVYEDDVDVFTWVRNGRTDNQTTFEAQVMDWSDDVSYSVHDVEDGIHAGHIEIGILDSNSGRAEIIEVAQEWYGNHFDGAALDAALSRLNELPSWPHEYTADLKGHAAMKNLTSTLVGRFCLAAQRATRERYPNEILTRYNAELVVPDEARYEVTALKALAARFVMSRQGADDFYRQQRQMINDLFGTLIANPETHLEPLYAGLWRAASSDSLQKRAVIDQVAALTDVSLTLWHQTLCA